MSVCNVSNCVHLCCFSCLDRWVYFAVSPDLWVVVRVFISFRMASSSHQTKCLPFKTNYQWLHYLAFHCTQQQSSWSSQVSALSWQISLLTVLFCWLNCVFNGRMCVCVLGYSFSNATIPLFVSIRCHVTWQVGNEIYSHRTWESGSAPQCCCNWVIVLDH